MRYNAVFIVAFAISLIVALASCAFLKDNPVIVDAATRQAVFRYVDAGKTEADKNARAKAVVDTVRAVDEFLEGNPTATADGLLAVAESRVDWDALAPADKLLVQDVLTLVRISIKNKQSEGLIDPETAVSLRAVFNTAVQAALLF